MKNNDNKSGKPTNTNRSSEDPLDLKPEELLAKLGTSVEGLSQSEAQSRLTKYGPNAIVEKKESTLLKFLTYFWGPIPWMIEIAAVLSAVVGHWTDFTIIIILLAFNAVVGFWQEHQAANAIEALKKQLAVKARVKRDGNWTEVDAATLVPGDIIRVRLGDIIPADIKLLDGEYLSVDQSALTGESLPVAKKQGDSAYSGSVAKQGEMVALTVETGSNTYFGRTAKLVSTASTPSHFQKAVLNIGNYLIRLSLALVIILFVVQIIRGDQVLHILEFALILTVASIPVAMPAVLSITMAIGAVALSKMKAIVSRLESIEEMAGIDVLCSDKTGTLTQNKLKLGDPAVFGKTTVQELIVAGALASKEENRDPIDLAVIGGVQPAWGLGKYRQIRFVPFDPVHKRTEAEIRDSDGQSFKVTKGAPQVVLDMCTGDKEIVPAVEARVEEFAHKGYRTLGVARSADGTSWNFLGLLPLFDPPREDSAETIKRAREHGIVVKMVTGDNVAIAKEISGQLGLGTHIEPADKFFKDKKSEANISPESEKAVEAAEGFAQVFPEHKFDIVRAIQHRGHIVGMTGDGVNDAPALKQADVGIAVSGATDAARAAAALVLTAPGLSVIVHAVESARRIFERMNSYAIYRITETIRIMLFMVSAMLVFNFYPITALMIILLAILNDLPILTIAYDNTWLDPTPVKWNMKRVLTTASVLGTIGVFETFGLMYLAKVVFGIDIAQLQSLIFLKLVVAGHLTLFVARSKNPFFSKPFPAPILLGAILFTQALAASIVGFGIFVTAIPWSWVGYIWAYCLIWIFVEDWAKLKVYERLDSRKLQSSPQPGASFSK
jgi:H+-transporting ATPase